MAVLAKQYAREYERVYAKTGSVEKAHAAASVVKKKKKSTWVSRMKRNVQMLLKGPKYYESLKKKGKK